MLCSRSYRRAGSSHVCRRVIQQGYNIVVGGGSVNGKTVKAVGINNDALRVFSFRYRVLRSALTEYLILLGFFRFSFVSDRPIDRPWNRGFL